MIAGKKVKKKAFEIQHVLDLSSRQQKAEFYLYFHLLAQLSTNNVNKKNKKLTHRDRKRTCKIALVPYL